MTTPRVTRRRVVAGVAVALLIVVVTVALAYVGAKRAAEEDERTRTARRLLCPVLLDDIGGPNAQRLADFYGCPR